MPLPEFEIKKPVTLEQALEILDKGKPGEIMVMAGGTDLVIRMKQGDTSPRMIVLLENIPSIDSIECSNGAVRIGARATFSRIIESDIIRSRAPILARACERIGAPQLRNRGTIGGNIANASPCADSVPPLVVLGARVVLASVSGKRSLPILECFRGPKENAFSHNEIITRIEFPVPPQPQNSFYLEKGQRNALSVTKLSVACQLELSGDMVQKIRIAYGAVGPTVLRGFEAEKHLKGKELTEESIKRASLLAAEETKPITDIRSTEEYRRTVTGVLLKKGLRQIAKIS